MYQDTMVDAVADLTKKEMLENDEERKLMFGVAGVCDGCWPGHAPTLLEQEGARVNVAQQYRPLSSTSDRIPLYCPMCD